MSGALEGADLHQIVRSAEQVDLYLPVAGPASRILAYAIDWMVIVLLQIALFIVLAASLFAVSALPETVQSWVAELLEGTEAGESFATGALLMLFVAMLLLQIVAENVYFLVAERVTGGASVGKRIARLRVVRDGGRPLDLRSSLVRNLLRIVDVLPSTYLVGLVAMVASPEGKRLGDLAAGTVVVRLDPPPVAPALRPATPEEIGSFRFDPAQRARIGSVERSLIRETLRRQDQLDPAAAAAARTRAVSVLCQRLEHEAVPEREQESFLRALLDASQTREP